MRQEFPVLLLELTPWYRAFLGNLADRLLFFRRRPPLKLTSSPADFWSDVFVERPWPTAAFRQSALYHLFLVTALWGFSHTYLAHPRALPARDPFAHQTITYYSVSEYLPAIDSPSDSEPAKLERKGDPAWASQRIISVPRHPDSRTQTIVAPPDIKLPHDFPLPNIVAWTPVPAVVPIAAAAHSAQQLVAPPMPAPVAPAPQVPHATAQMRFDTPSTVVEPAPALSGPMLRTSAGPVMKTTVVEAAPSLETSAAKNPNLPLPSAVEPPPSVSKLRRPGDMNVANLDVKVVEPRLPVAEQLARGSLLEGAPQHGGSAGGSGSPAIPAPPSTQAAGQGGDAQAAGRFIALGVRPAPVTGPISIPQGNRTGSFAAGPQGKLGAAGTPGIKGGGTTNGAGGSGTNPNGSSPGHGSGPAGIFVERGPSVTAGQVVVAAPARQQAPAAEAPASGTLLASLTRPSISDLARKTAPSAPQPQVESQVFGGKKYYSMTLNMPNLVSASGSWIIRFAELHVSTDKGELTAPVATQKVDPAYPSDLIRQRVEGTVVLYAIIHTDGSVGEVRVLHGIDDRLDRNARAALAKWHFRPGTKNGSAVDLEAVVQIPFSSKQLPY